MCPAFHRRFNYHAFPGVQVPRDHAPGLARDHADEASKYPAGCAIPADLATEYVPIDQHE